MGSKLPMIGVVALGMVAAVGAALLTAAMRIKPASAAAAGPTTASVVVAARDLDAMSRLEESDLEVREVPPSEAPADRHRDPVNLLGRLVRTPLVKGQPVLAGSLLKEGAGAKLALSLPDGARAVSIELSGPSALRGLIYPGSRVDVLASERGGYAGNGSDAKLLLQNVRVLAVDDKTVFDAEDESAGDEDDPARAVRGGARMLVTIMVQPAEARLLQAARERGELSLSLRNPLDGSIEKTAVASPAADGGGAAAAAGPLGSGRDAEAGAWTTRVVRGTRTRTVEFDSSGRPVELDDPAQPRTGAPPPPPPPGGGPAGGGGDAGSAPSRDDGGGPTEDDSGPLARARAAGHDWDLASARGALEGDRG